MRKEKFPTSRDEQLDPGRQESTTFEKVEDFGISSDVALDLLRNANGETFEDLVEGYFQGIDRRVGQAASPCQQSRRWGPKSSPARP